MEYFYSLASSSKTKRDIGMGPTGEMIVTYRATNALSTKSGCGAVLAVFCLPEVGRCRQNASCQQKQGSVAFADTATIFKIRPKPLNQRYFLYICGYIVYLHYLGVKGPNHCSTSFRECNAQVVYNIIKEEEGGSNKKWLHTYQTYQLKHHI